MDQNAHATSLRHALVEQLKERGNLHNPAVEAAFRAVPRHLFLPGLDDLEKVYSDDAIATKFDGELAISSSSQPSMMAIMLEQLALEPGQHILEIGAGTGYNAALMAYLVGNTGRVTTLDLDQDIVQQARQNLDSAGFPQVELIQADGGYGYPPSAPYDRIILTVGSWDIAPAWLDQLAPAGRILLPLSLNGPQKSVAFVRAGDHLVSDSIHDCGFIHLRGAFAGPEQQLQLAAEGGLYLSFEGEVAVEPAAIYDWLNHPAERRPTSVRVALPEIWRGLTLWLALHEPHLATLTATGDEVERGRVPCLFTFSGNWRTCFTSGLLGEKGLALLAWPPRHHRPPPDDDDEETLPLWVWQYGPDETLAERLIHQVQAWDAAGRPGNDGLRIRVYPATHPYQPAANEVVVPKRWTKLVVDWRLEIGD